MPRRAYGSGALLVVKDGQGHETFYGKWRQGDRQVKRRIGRKRAAASKDGLTKAMAERELRQMMGAPVDVVGTERGVTVVEAAERYVESLVKLKPSTRQDYDGYIRGHMKAYFTDRAISRVDVVMIEGFRDALLRDLGPKTVRNVLTFLHGVFEYGAMPRRAWIAANPVRQVDLPHRPDADDQDIRFLTVEEVDALISAVPDDQLGDLDRAVYLTASETGLRQGELAALRWRDVDFPAGLVRVRRSITRGVEGTPKSSRGSRAVPMTDRVAGALDRLSQITAYDALEGRVFCHPATGGPYDASQMRKRFKKAMIAAGMGDRYGRRGITFHSMRHTFGTCMAAAGVPMRTLQEWMGHRDITTTLIYSHYAPSAEAKRWAEQAFQRGPKYRSGTIPSESTVTLDDLPSRPRAESEGTDTLRPGS